MFQSPFFTWLKRPSQVAKGRPARVRRDPLRGRLYLEILEDRTLLNATVTDVAVSGTAPTSPVGVGQTVSIEVDFSQKVNVSGTPTLTLSDGATASYHSGSGSTALIFNYVVGSGDTTHGANLDYASTTALSGGTITDATGPNNGGTAVDTLPALAGSTDTFGKAGIVIDGTTPTVTSVTSSPTNSTYGASGSVAIDVNFSEAVNVTSGTPTLTLSDGETATYSSGSGSGTLLFTYAVRSGDTTNGAALNATALSGNITNTAKSGTAESANLSLTGGTQLSASDVVIDATTPTVTGVSVSPSTSGTYGSGTYTFTVTMSEAVTAGGNAALTLSDGETVALNGTNSTTLTGTYTVKPGDTTNGAALDVTGLSGTVTNAGGVQANLTINDDTVAGDNIIIDATTPTVTGVSVSPSTSGTYGSGTYTFTVTMSEAVTAGGDAALTLSDGETVALSGTNSTTLTGTYTIKPGDTTNGAALDVTGLSGTITNAVGVQANLTINGDTVAGDNIIIDATTPTVTTVTSPTSAGTYGTGATVTLDVNFSEAVTVDTTNGTPTLALSDGAAASYSSGSSSTTLVFTYTVGAGDTTNGSALDVGTITLNSGTIKNAGGVAANLAINGDTVAGDNIIIDTTTPTVTTVTSPTSAGTYGTGATVTLDVNFSKAVTVDTTNGTPTLSLSDGKSAAYSNGSGSTTLVFTYTVGAGDTTNGSALDVGTISLNSGTIKNAGGVAANLAINGDTVAGDNIIIDATTPTVTGVSVSPNTSGTYGTGATFTLDVNFSEAVTVDTTNGTPTLSLSDGKSAAYSSGSGSTTLVFTYTVGAGDTTNGSALDVGTITLNSGTIKNAGGVAANLAINGDTVAGDNIIIDATTPTVTTVTSPTSAGTYGTGATVTLDVNFSEAVTVDTTNGTPTLALSDGAAASYSSGSSSTTLVFTYTVGAGDTTNGSALDVGTITLNSGTIKNAGGVAANLAINGDTVAGDNIIIDATTPTVTTVTSPTSAGTYGTGATVTLDVNFSAAVTVDTTNGTPTLSLSDGKSAAYSNGSGSTTLVFTYTVGAGDTTNGSALDVGTISLNGGTIKNAGGVAANLAINGDTVAGDNIIIDTTTATVTGVSVSPNTGGTYGTGATFTLDVNFSKAVTVDTTNGTPTLALSDGAAASYSSGSSSTTLVFTYTVGAGDTTNGSALDLSGANPLALNGGTIKNAGGVAADLTIHGDAVGNKGIVIDATTPRVLSVDSSTNAGTYAAGAKVSITLLFSEPVTVTGTPTLTLSDGRTASYTIGTGTSTLVFTYTVQSGDTTNGQALDYASATALNLSGGTIKSAAGTAAALNLPTPDGVNDFLAADKIIIDAVRPTPAPTPTPTSTPAPSIQGQIKQLVQDLVSMEQSISTGNAPAFFHTLQAFESLLATVEQEIFQIIRNYLSHAASQSK